MLEVATFTMCRYIEFYISYERLLVDVGGAQITPLLLNGWKCIVLAQAFNDPSVTTSKDVTRVKG